MSCGYSKEVLALYIEGDLPDRSADEVKNHVVKCAECEQFCEDLQKSQSWLKSLRSTAATPAAIIEMRQTVMSQLDHVQENLGWAVRIERFMLLGFRRWKYAAACVAILGVLTVLTASVDGHRPPFDSTDTLARPDGYRDWISAGSSDPSRNVYINPAAYRAFSATGKFPEGTVMVLETNASAIQVSVKNSRFAGGWAYFDFPDKLKARAAADEGSCRTCHEARAETDHVFTQFYPTLRVRRG